MAQRRNKTNTEMAKELCKAVHDQTWVHPVIWAAPHEKLVEACQLAGIPIEVEE